jgi:hypothetical protein
MEYCKRDIIAITVCVNYDDILKHTIIKNVIFFKMWYIITSIDDTKTIELIEKHNFPNIKLIFFNDFYTNSKFNKGGAIKYAQEYIEKIEVVYDKILILDADIALPENFLNSLPETLETKTLYGVSNRFDYWTLEDFNNSINSHEYKHGADFVGFFQLYKKGILHKYNNSLNCSECDNYFRDCFEKKEYLNITVKHLGMNNVNWEGRKYNLGVF